MDEQFGKLIEINISGRVFAICQSRRVLDPTIIGYYINIMRQAVQANLTEDYTFKDFNRVLAEQLLWLESEIDETARANTQNKSIPTAAEAADGAGSLEKENEANEPQKKPSGYVPQAKSRGERLAEQRAGMQRLLENDCVTLKLITPEQAQNFKRRMLGQEPQEAEQELVAELRNILHEQVRGFVRKHDGGPWASPTLQHELRMDITSTRSLRSLISLARELLRERESWLEKSRSSLSGRLFGGKITFS